MGVKNKVVSATISEVVISSYDLGGSRSLVSVNVCDSDVNSFEASVHGYLRDAISSPVTVNRHEVALNSVKMQINGYKADCNCSHMRVHPSEVGKIAFK